MLRFISFERFFISDWLATTTTGLFNAWIFSFRLGLDWIELGEDSLLSRCAWTRLELARLLWLAEGCKIRRRTERGDVEETSREEEEDEGGGLSLRCHDDRYYHGLPLPPQLYASTVTCFAGTPFKYPIPLFLMACAHSLAWWLDLVCFGLLLHFLSLAAVSLLVL